MSDNHNGWALYDPSTCSYEIVLSAKIHEDKDDGPLNLTDGLKSLAKEEEAPLPW